MYMFADIYYKYRVNHFKFVQLGNVGTEFNTNSHHA